MKYYVAPLEGITGYIFRNAHHKYFPGTDKYYIPFIEPKPNSKKIFNAREYNDILPKHNQRFYAVPQILTNKAEDFIWTAGHLIDYGYKEINLNLGCPSKTVVSKQRGSGFLSVPDALDKFLDTIFNRLDVSISIKTRLGRFSGEEFYKLLEIYNRYPVKELTIHPRTQQDFYKNTPNLQMFEESLSLTNHPVCYNGNLFTERNIYDFEEKFPTVERIMLGRGIIANPGLICQIKDKKPMDVKTLKAYHDEIYNGYKEVLQGDIPVLYKMKELWCYMACMFEDKGKFTKNIKKAANLKSLDTAVAQMFENCPLNTAQGYLS